MKQRKAPTDGGRVVRLDLENKRSRQNNKYPFVARILEVALHIRAGKKKRKEITDKQFLEETSFR